MTTTKKGTSTARKLRRQGVIAPAKRNFNPEEMLNLQQSEQYIAAKRFELTQVRSNTALVPDGVLLADQLTAVIHLLENAKHAWLTHTLMDCGYPPGTLCNVNLKTGEITLTENVEA